MSEPQNEFQNPQEIFAAFAKQAEGFMQSFAAEQNQEMLKQFSQAWNSIADDAAKEPQKWMHLVQEYQQQQMNLWMSFWQNPTAERQAVVAPSKGDRRFVGDAWNENPVFDYLKQSYLLTSEMLMKSAQAANLDEENQKRLNFYTRYFVDAMSPSNFAMTNPEVMQQALDTKGQSLLDGLKNLIADMEKGRISMTDESAFVLGENLATTPGAVVFENDLMQLIQYAPSTDSVAENPVVIVPPCINKYYIMDLQPKNSLVKYMVDQGHTVFLISWINPDVELSDTTWDDYIEKGVLQAFDIAKTISGAKKLNPVAWCVGGTLLGMGLSVLHARRKQAMIGSATYLTTMLDFSEPGDIGVFINEAQLAHREAQLKHTKVLSGKDLALAFNMLRSNDLIWSYVVNNYLKGQSPAPFDILYWNSDSTNLPAAMYSYYLRNMYIENNVTKPDALEVCGTQNNLTKIKTPSYFLSTIDDHIAPWQTTFKSTEIMAGPIEFVLGGSGHIAGVINPPYKEKRNHWVSGQLGEGAQKWLESAQSKPGSWWPHWSEWIKQYAGEQVPARSELGNKDYPVIEAAPGRYVKRRIDSQ